MILVRYGGHKFSRAEALAKHTVKAQGAVAKLGVPERFKYLPVDR
jgi:hypothetical protein